MKAIRWGIIGVGDVCEVKSGPGFQKAPHSELVAVMRRNASKAADFAKRHNVPKWTDNAQVLLEDPTIDAIYIATPPHRHLEYAQAALAAQKHVYIEKPMALNANEARVVLDAANNASNKVCIAHYRRRLPLYQKIKEILDTKSLGQVRRVSLETIQSANDPLVASSEINWRWQPEISGGGIFHDLSPHQLDLMLWFFGEPQSVLGFSLRRNAQGSCDDCVSGQMLFSDNIAFQGYWDFDDPKGKIVDDCQIDCERGSLAFSFFRSSQLRITSENGTEKLDLPPPETIQQPMIEAVNAYFRGEDTNPCSAATGLKVMEMIDGLARPS